MPDPRRAALYATLAETYAALARLEAEDAGVVVGAPPVPANDSARNAPPKRKPCPARPMPTPDPDVPIDDVTRGRAKGILRRLRSR